MISGLLSDFEALGLNVCGAATRRAVDWIRSLPDKISEGTSELAGGMHARILRYPTTAGAAGRFETHRRFVDLQYTLSGIEILEWIPRISLIAEGGYDEEKDLLLYGPGPMPGRIVAGPGYFSIFTPMDAHRGGIRSDERHPEVLKLVVKIPVRDFPPIGLP